VTDVAVFPTSPDARQPARAVATVNRAAVTRTKRIMRLSFARQGGWNGMNRPHRVTATCGGGDGVPEP